MSVKKEKYCETLSLHRISVNKRAIRQFIKEIENEITRLGDFTGGLHKHLENIHILNPFGGKFMQNLELISDEFRKFEDKTFECLETKCTKNIDIKEMLRIYIFDLVMNLIEDTQHEAVLVKMQRFVYDMKKLLSSEIVNRESSVNIIFQRFVNNFKIIQQPSNECLRSSDMTKERIWRIHSILSVHKEILIKEIEENMKENKNKNGLELVRFIIHTDCREFENSITSNIRILNALSRNTGKMIKMWSSKLDIITNFHFVMWEINTEINAKKILMAFEKEDINGKIRFINDLELLIQNLMTESRKHLQ